MQETKIKGYLNIVGYKVLADENVDPARATLKSATGQAAISENTKFDALWRPVGNQLRLFVCERVLSCCGSKLKALS